MLMSSSPYVTEQQICKYANKPKMLGSASMCSLELCLNCEPVQQIPH